MNNAIYEFMNSIMDYAGLFPPAELSLEKSISNYNHYLKSSENWMLSKFIIPAGILNQIPPLLKLEKVSDKFSFSVIISDSEKDLENIIKFKKSFSKIEIGALEVKPQMRLESLLNNIQFIRNEINNDINIFIESSINPDNTLIEELVKLRNQDINIGYKLRTGGITQDAFPSPDIIASVIKSCAEKRIPFKATAGLHHPFTRFDSSVNTKMYGFVNIFAAGLFAVKFLLNETDLIKIITDENPHNFLFENNLIWRDYEISSGDISEIRRKYFISFGSCSFDEPREDLKNLKLL